MVRAVDELERGRECYARRAFAERPLRLPASPAIPA
jgi:hypothetical protein